MIDVNQQGTDLVFDTGRFIVIKELGIIDPYPLSFDEADWNNELGIQRKTELTIFRDCDTIPLRWQYNKPNPHQVANRTEFFNKYYDLQWFRSLFSKLSDYYGGGHFISLLFARLKPYGELKPHIDGGRSVVHNYDVHIPITTNEDCKFTVMGKTEHLEVGKIYEVDNTLLHSVTNGGTPRIHLIVEWHNPEKSKGYYDTIESVHGDGRIYRIWKKL